MQGRRNSAASGELRQRPSLQFHSSPSGRRRSKARVAFIASLQEITVEQEADWSSKASMSWRMI